MAQAQPSLAYIGLGNMGSGMAKNLALKANLDKPVILYNRTPARSERLVAELPEGKARLSTSIDEVVQSSDIIFMSLGDDDAVLGIIGAILKNDVHGKVVVDTSTASRQATTKAAELVSAAGGEFVACPVFGSPVTCQQGQLICVPAGPAASVDKVLPFCTGVMGRAAIPFHDQVPSVAVSLKSIGNSILFNAQVALAEGHVLADKSGVGREHLHKFVEYFYPPYVPYSERMITGAYYQYDHPPFSVDHVRKDIRFAKELANDTGVPLKALEVADQHYTAIQQHMNGETADLTAVYGAVRKESGLCFESHAFFPRPN